MEQGFLGTGVGYSFFSPAGVGLDEGDQIAEASGEDLVRQSIWLILSTAVGERVGRPDFGCRIHDLVFATRSEGTMGDAIRAVREALALWEPRIDVIEVDAYPDETEASALIIEVHYHVRATNSRYNMVYPFYLST